MLLLLFSFELLNKYQQQWLLLYQPISSSIEKRQFGELIKVLQTNEENHASISKRFKDIRYMTLKNKVYNLKHFVHPGGNYLIENLQGQDMARYLYGN